MKFLVTGAAGFIGSQLCEELLKNRDEVVGVDNLNDYYDSSLKLARLSSLEKNMNFDFIKIDVSSHDELSVLFNTIKFDKVFHLAAQAGVRLKIGDFSKYIDSNIIGFTNILKLSVEHQISDFLYASSSSVYGNSKERKLTEDSTVTRPTSYYGSTKLFNENSASVMVRGTQTRARGLRFFTVYGPAGRPDMAYFRIVNSLVSDQTFNLFGDGKSERDFTYISDVTRAVSLLATELSNHEHGYSDVVNIGGGRPVSILALISTIAKKIGKSPRVNYLSRDPNDVAITFADAQRIKNLIGFVPEVTLDDGLDLFLKWALMPENSIQLRRWVESSI